jgi:GT2 family glycosyltransferase
MKPLVAVVIVVWNGVEDTLECLRSLEEDKYPNKRILVIDNCSSDGSVERIHAEGIRVSVIKCPLNLGFTGGNNVGLAEATRLGAKYAFLLNNDTTLSRDALTILVDAAEAQTQVGLLSPVVNYYDTPGEVWFAGATLSLPRGEALHCKLPDYLRQPICSGGAVADLQIVPSEWVSGCAMLVRMRALWEVGGFDDRFFLTWEDVDWCVRMRRSKWDVVVVPNARIYHKCGRSGARMVGIHRYYAVRNSLLLAAKHAGPFYFSALFWVLCRHFRGALGSGQTDKKQNLVTVFEGLKDHLLGRYGRRSTVEKRKSKNGPAEPQEPKQREGDVCVSSK